MTAREIIEKYKETQGRDFSQREIASILRWSPGTLSGVLSGSYPNTADKEAEMAKVLLGVETRTEAKDEAIQIRDSIIATKNFVQVYELCNGLIAPESSLTASIGLITGDAGMGKTTAVQRYAVEHPAAAYILYMGFTRTALFKEIAEAIVGRSARAYYDNLQLIMGATRVYRRLIIIDEADRMPQSMLEDLRTLNEHGKVPLLLVGEPNLAVAVKRADRIESRIRKPRITFSPIDAATLAALYSESCGLKITEKVASALAKLAHGDFRIAANDMQNIVRLMNVSGIHELTMGVVDDYKRQ